uniref:Uncharacterized protein n=1 Tax=Heterorhabditis bacteriophora TaxID=37862 RepID=A0A1I7XFB4_HETBA
MAGILQYLSRGSEEGFHSGSSTDESPSYIDRLAYQMTAFEFNENRFTSSQQKCSSDSGASTGELEQLLAMKEESVTTGYQLPGSWFYEMGDDMSTSPTNELDEIASLRSALGVRNLTESVEVPSSEHVAEIVGRQGLDIIRCHVVF